MSNQASQTFEEIRDFLATAREQITDFENQLNESAMFFKHDKALVDDGKLLNSMHEKTKKMHDELPIKDMIVALNSYGILAKMAMSAELNAKKQGNEQRMVAERIKYLETKLGTERKGRGR